jgi:GNAT superfamily N-acetyltransferase
MAGVSVTLDELRLMQGLARRVTERSPALLNGDATLGELAWVWGHTYDALSPFWRHRTWFEGGELMAWGWARLPFQVRREDGTLRQSSTANMNWQTHPDRPELLHQVLDWYDEVAGDADREMIVQSADAASQAIVAAHGYVLDAEEASDDGSWHQFNSRGLADVPAPALPDGFRFLCAADVTPAEAVKAHCDAWQSANFTVAAYERVRRTWPYRADLHPLVAAPDGTLAATAIIWLDEATRTAEFEPVGAHPDFRRRGLGAALQLHGMRLAKAAGATRMFVACVGAPSNPGPRALYESVGFRPISHDLPRLKRLGR